MARRWLKSLLRPELQAELRHALGRRPEDLQLELGKLLVGSAVVPVGLLRAIGNALLGKDKHVELKVSRREVGRPGKRAQNTPDPVEVLAGVRTAENAGACHKNAVLDVGTEFGISRATVYRLLAEAKGIEREESLRENMRKGAEPKAVKKMDKRPKRARRRARRHTEGLKLRSWLQVKLDKSQLRRAIRMQRWSQKRED